MPDRTLETPELPGWRKPLATPGALAHRLQSLPIATHGYFVLMLRAHLPFVRHPEHEKCPEGPWLFEAITETYLPPLQVLDRCNRDGVFGRLTLSLWPTLCTMLTDPLLQRRFKQLLRGLIELAVKESLLICCERAFHELAWISPHLNAARQHMTRASPSFQ